MKSATDIAHITHASQMVLLTKPELVKLTSLRGTSRALGGSEFFSEVFITG
jgi:hypothetical protein